MSRDGGMGAPKDGLARGVQSGFPGVPAPGWRRVANMTRRIGPQAIFGLKMRCSRPNRAHHRILRWPPSPGALRGR